MLGHVRNEVTEHAAMSEERMRAGRARVGLWLTVHIEGFANRALVLQLHFMPPFPVMTPRGLGLMSASPSRPFDDESDDRHGRKQQSRDQMPDFRNPWQSTRGDAQPSRSTGLLSFSLRPAICRS